MKLTNSKWKLLSSLLFASLFLNGLCSHGDAELPTPTTDEYVTWRIPNHNGNMSEPPDNLNGVHYNNLNVATGVTNTSPASYFYVNWLGPQSAGNYSSQDVLITTGGKNYVQSGTPLQINVTEFGSTGGLLKGSYSGIVKDSTSAATYSITGEFRMRVQ
jgi:hypothetical protein